MSTNAGLLSVICGFLFPSNAVAVQRHVAASGRAIVSSSALGYLPSCWHTSSSGNSSSLKPPRTHHSLRCIVSLSLHSLTNPASPNLLTQCTATDTSFMSGECHSPVLRVHDLELYTVGVGTTRATTWQSDERLICAEACTLQHPSQPSAMSANIVGIAQEALKTGAQESAIFDQHHYRWLTHASKICNRRQRGGSDASVVPFLDIWTLEFHKRHGRLLRQQVGGANGVVNPVVLPFHRTQVSRKFRGLKRGTHAICERYPVADTLDNTSDDTKSGDRGHVLGDRSSAAASQCPKTYVVEGLARYPEAARGAERRASCRAVGSRQTTAPPLFSLRELQAGDRRSADAVCISGNQ